MVAFCVTLLSNHSNHPRLLQSFTVVTRRKSSILPLKLSIKNLISLTIFDNFDFFVFRCSFWNTNDRRKFFYPPIKIWVDFSSVSLNSVPCHPGCSNKSIYRIPPCDHQPPKNLDQRSLQKIASKNPSQKLLFQKPLPGRPRHQTLRGADGCDG